MSIQPLEDPGQAFLDEGWQPTPSTVAEDSPDLLRIAAEMAAAFIVGRVLIRAYLSRHTPGSPVEAEQVSNDAWKAIAPMWMQVAVPAVVAAYRFGSDRVVPFGQLEEMAIDYATEMGSYIHQTSTEAVLEGFTSQLVSGTQPAVAWPRAVEGYGLDRRQMRAYVSSLVTQPYSTEIVPPQARESVQRAVMTRADVLGTNEAFRATQIGRNISWLILASSGDLPQGTQKRWITAADERVCGVCGPLDQVTIPLHWKFETIGGERFLAPGVHPNCRCTLELVYPQFEDVVKAMPGDPFDRDSEGQFASFESRQAKPKGKTQAEAFGAKTRSQADAFGTSPAHAFALKSIEDAFREVAEESSQQADAFAQPAKSNRMRSWTIVLVRNADGSSRQVRVEGSGEQAKRFTGKSAENFPANFGGRVYWDATEFLVSTNQYDRWMTDANSNPVTDPVVLDLDSRSTMDGGIPNIYRARGFLAPRIAQDMKTSAFLDAVINSMPAVSATGWAAPASGRNVDMGANQTLSDDEQMLYDSIEWKYESIVEATPREALLEIVWNACENSVYPAKYEDLGQQLDSTEDIHSFQDVQRLPDDVLRQRLIERYFFEAQDKSTLTQRRFLEVMNEKVFSLEALEAARSAISPGLHQKLSAASMTEVSIPVIVRFDDFWGVDGGETMDVEGRYTVDKLELVPLVSLWPKDIVIPEDGSSSLDLLRNRISERDDLSESQKDQTMEDAQSLGAVYVATVTPISRSAFGARQENLVRNEGWRD